MEHHQATSSALLEQLVYIDNFVNHNANSEELLTPNLDMDGQLSLDLAAFADDSFIFPDEDKKDDFDESEDDKDESPKGPEKDKIGTVNNPLLSPYNNQSQIPQAPSAMPSTPDASHLIAGVNSLSNSLKDLPKFPVPPGAKLSLENVGLSKNQIDLLSALVAQHQSSIGNFPNRPPAAVSRTPSQLSASPQVRQHSQVKGINSSASSSTTITPQAIQTPASSSDMFSELTDLDKRRRNTEASARFRIKKKMKERQMESQIASLSDLVKNFESKIQQLEMENRLLKNLIIEKGSEKSDNELRILKERAKYN